MRTKSLTPPKAAGSGTIAGPRPLLATLGIPVPAGLSVLRVRADFLRAAQAKRHGAGSFLLQARARGDASPGIRVGFTASKKIGNAVLRNRAKRRLREIARAILPAKGVAGWDYVLVARPQMTVARDFVGLLADLDAALQAVHKGPKA